MEEILQLKVYTSRIKYILFISFFIFLSQMFFAEGGGYAVTKQLPDAGYSSIIYDATNGLPTSDANYILGSKDGYVWIGGYSGIIRYDGNIFERLPTANGLTSARAFFEDSKHRIWVGTNDNGIAVLDGQNIRQYTYKDGLPSSSIRNFAEDKEGNIFIATTTGLALIKENGLLYRVPVPAINNERILKLEADHSGKIYGVTASGIVFGITNKEVTEVYTSEELGMERITSILADPINAGIVYLCCEGGTIYYGSFGKKSSELQKIDISPIKTVQWISYDCFRIWICSRNQIAYLDKDNKLNIVSNLAMNGSIEMLTSDYQGNIWVCSSTQGVMKIVANNFVNISGEAKLPKSTVNATCLHNESLYIGTENGLLILDKNNNPVRNELTDFIEDSRIRCIKEDNDKNIWIGTFTNDKGLICQTPDGKITSFTMKEGMSDNRIRVIKTAKDNSILCGTNNGFSIIKNQKVVKSIGKNEVINNTVFLSVEECEDGKIYLGTDGEGIYIISGSEIQHYGRDEGLTSDVVMRIKEDKKNNVIWIVTSNSIQYIKDGKIKTINSFPYNNNYDLYLNDNNEVWVLASCGIYSVSAQSLLSDDVKDYRLYTVANGLPSSVTSNSYSALDEKGNLYICCREGVSLVNINNYLEHKIQIKTALNSIYCGNQKILPTENGNYIIPASDERIKITASVMDYSMTNPPVRVFLEGAKDEGITVNRNELSSLEYTNLSYGYYTFHIQVLSQNKDVVLIDNTFSIIKRFRLIELMEFKFILISLLILAAGFIVWRVLKSTVILNQYRQLQTAKEDAERANSTKSRFLSNMSKEIITPLNTIMCMDEMILREEAKNVPKNYFLSMINYGMNIHTATESLLTLINDLLEMTKIESGTISLSETEYDVQEILRSIIFPIRQKSTEKELKFDIYIDQLLPSRLYGDVGKIKQILLNLLSNAVKYTEDGGFELSITMESRTNEYCDISIRVKDSGNGMKPEVMETIFDAYGAFEKDAKEFHLKTGLGLDISRRFAELMGGALVCKSEVGKGSEFIFTLSQKIINPVPIGPFSEHESIITRGPYIPQFVAPDADILVASENLVNLNLLDSLLKATKVFITRANNRQEFIDKIRRNSFNVAFIDQLLFENSEEKIEEIISSIRQIDSKLAVYILTEGSSFDEKFYKSKGYTGILTIPVNYELLERTIMRHLPQEMMMIPDSNSVIEEIKEFPENLKWLYDVEGLSVMEGIKNSNSISNFIFGLKLFLDTIDDNIQIIDNVYKKGDFSAYRVRNGIIRNSARIIGATSLFEFTSKIEDAFKHDDKIFIASNTEKLLNEYRSFKEKLEKLNEDEKLF